MKVIICISKNNGHMFCGKRQSSDSIIIQDISQVIGKDTLIVSTYTYKTYPNIDKYGIRFKIYDDISYLKENLSDDWIFIEDLPISYNISKLITYKWDVDYPATSFFNICEYGKFKRISKNKYSSEVHKKITKEIYIREFLST